MLGDKDAMAKVAVKDFAAAKAFYGDTLGLEATETDNGTGVAVYRSGGTSIVVYRSEYAGTNRATSVTWGVGDEVGLKFHEPFDLNQLAKSKPEVITSNWQRPEFVKEPSAWDSPQPEDWDRMSLEELQESLEGFLKY